MTSKFCRRYFSAMSSRFVRAAIALSCTAALVWSGTVPAAAATSPGSGAGMSMVVPSTTSPQDTVDAAVSAAQQSAVQSGNPVVVDELTTPTELTTAMPDGTVQYEASSQPARALKQSAWVPVDTDLTRVGEWWVPVATAAPVRFSPGGGDVLAQVQDPATDAWVSEVWPYGDLPTPVIEADTATYAEVFAGWI